MALSNWPTITDDDGSLIVGTVINKAVFDAIRASIEDDVFSATNPTVTGEDIIDEVVDARGSMGSLDARLDVALNEDGSLKTAASLVTATQAATIIGSTNLARNSGFDLWQAGASAAPDGWTLSGSGATIAKSGTGLGDTTVLDAGDYCAKITYGSAEAKLTQNILQSAEVTKWARFKGKTVAVGIRCKASVASQASIVVDDGVGTTRGGSTGNGTYHSGNSTNEWIYCTHTISASATKLDVYVSVASAGTAYFGGAVVIFSSIAVTDWTPKPTEDSFAGILDKFGGSSANSGTGFSTLRTIYVPPNMLSRDGDCIRLSAYGDYANNANTKDVRLTVFGTTLTTGGSGAHTNTWGVEIMITRTSSTAVFYKVAYFRDGSLTTAAQATISALTLTNALTILIEGSSNAASSDVLLFSSLTELIR